MRPSPTCSGSCQSPVRRLGMWLGLFAALSGAQACVAAGHAIRGTVTGLEPTRLRSGTRADSVCQLCSRRGHPFVGETAELPSTMCVLEGE